MDSQNWFILQNCKGIIYFTSHKSHHQQLDVAAEPWRRTQELVGGFLMIYMRDQASSHVIFNCVSYLMETIQWRSCGGFRHYWNTDKLSHTFVTTVRLRHDKTLPALWRAESAGFVSGTVSVAIPSVITAGIRATLAELWWINTQLTDGGENSILLFFLFFFLPCLSFDLSNSPGARV